MKIKRMLCVAVCFIAVAVCSWYSNRAPKLTQPERFIKVDQTGRTVHPWQGPWACNYDTSTGLLWELKRDDESVYDGYWTYSWFDGTLGAENQGDCYFESSRCDTLDLIVRANQQRLCQVSGWRLPTVYEVQSLLVKQDRPQQAQLAVDYFRFIKHGDYWTAQNKQQLSGHFAHLKQGATAINFFSGQTHSLPYRNAAFVMLVSDQRPSALSP